MWEMGVKGQGVQIPSHADFFMYLSFDTFCTLFHHSADWSSSALQQVKQGQKTQQELGNSCFQKRNSTAKNGEAVGLRVLLIHPEVTAACLV